MPESLPFCQNYYFRDYLCENYYETVKTVIIGAFCVKTLTINFFYHSPLSKSDHNLVKKITGDSSHQLEIITLSKLLKALEKSNNISFC